MNKKGLFVCSLVRWGSDPSLHLSLLFDYKSQYEKYTNRELR